MALNTILVLSLFFTLCLCQFSSSNFKQTVCLYSSASTKVLTPLKLTKNDCKTNSSYCMNQVYKYSDFQYAGVASLKPVKGEVAMFLSQDAEGIIDYVSFLNANTTTKMNVSVEITGAEPTNIIFKDDPDDIWLWNPQTNKGSFLWETRPTYTDGVIIGHIDFIDNYCIRSSYKQSTTTTGQAPINQLSVFSGTVAAPTRILSVPYTAGSTFEFCQYPRTATVYTNSTCPNSNNGKATVTIAFGPVSRFTWYRDDGSVLATNVATVENLAPGIYHVLVNDTTSMGCTAERSVVISAPFLLQPTVTTTPFSCSVKGSASVTPNGGSGGFSYQWKKGATVIGTGSSISNLTIGTYTATVTDSCGSVMSTQFDILTSGCCGDGICQLNEVCGEVGSCPGDCGVCCPAGTYKDGNECQVCAAGSRSTTIQATSCTTCDANTFNAGGNDACAPCPENTYSAEGSDKCLRCAVGKVRPQGASTCVTCGDGKFADSCGGCVDAPAGSYAVDGNWAPTPCPAGTYSGAGWKECTKCDIGSYSGSGAASCTPCPTGKTTVLSGAHHVLLCQ